MPPQGGVWRSRLAGSPVPVLGEPTRVLPWLCISRGCDLCVHRFQDECAFHGNDDVPYEWCEGGKMSLKQKSRGALLMVSDYTSRSSTALSAARPPSATPTSPSIPTR
eukprot:7391984-Prymnesium_polylepis.1